MIIKCKQMRQLLLIFFLGSGLWCFGQQTQQSQVFFAQCALNGMTAEECDQLNTQLKDNPDVMVVRVDPLSNTLFLLTQNVSSLNQTTFDSWLGEFSDNYTCLNIGVRGVDMIKPNPKQGCDE